jgi:hypothetical protein
MRTVAEEMKAEYTCLPTRDDIYKQQQYATWLRQFRWSLYVTFTFSHDVSQGSAQARLESYLQELELKLRAPLSCVIAMETKYSGLGTPAGRVHFHLLVGCACPIDKRLMQNLWNESHYGGNRVSGQAALILPYDERICASFYLLKTLHDPSWDWKERNLDLISPTHPASCATSTRARRRIRRNQSRLLVASLARTDRLQPVNRL